MQMDVSVELLIPGVEDTGDAQLAFQFVFGKAQEGFGHRAEEDVEDRFFVAECQGIEFVGQCEDGMEVGDGQEFGLSGGEPAGFGERLTFGAMTVPAGVIRVARKAASIALLEVAAQSNGAASLDGSHDFEM